MSMITTKNIDVSFGSLHVLKGVNLEVKPQEVVCIIGPSGSGKSTFLRSLIHLEHIDNGIIEIEGKEIAHKENKSSKLHISTKERRKRLLNVGMVFQKFNLFPHMTALENTMVSPMNVLGKSKEEARAKGSELLNAVGLGDKLDAYPNKLSGGQQQRVAIARAVVAGPKLILADEPTGNLDSKNGKEVMDLLKELNAEGTTIVMVTHSQKDAAQAQRTIDLFDGQIVSDVKNEL